MDVLLRQEADNVRVLWIAGVLKKAEFDAAVKPEVEQWGPQTHVRVLVLAEDFQGWEQNEEWGDVSFFFEYGDRIELQRGFCVKHGVYVVLKGAHTSICGPDGPSRRWVS